MPKRVRQEDREVRKAFASELKRIKKTGVPVGKIAEALCVKRQAVYQYIRGDVTASSRVLRLACERLGVQLRIKDQIFGSAAFSSVPVPKELDRVPVQLGLSKLFDKLKEEDFEARVVSRKGSTFTLEFKIRIA